MKNLGLIIANLGRGGAEKIAYLIGEYLSSYYNVYVYHLCGDKPYFKFSEKVRVNHMNICKTFDNQYLRIFNKIIQANKLKKQFKKDKIDLLISFITDTNILVLLSNILYRAPLIICEHSIFQVNEKRSIISFARKILYPFATKVVVLTNLDKQNYIKFIKSKKLMVIPNPLKINNLYSKIKFENKSNIILAVGRFNKLKGFDKLVKAFAEIKNKKGYKLYIVGGQGNVNKLDLKPLIKELNLENEVVLPGFVNNIDELYMKAKIFVLSSEYEALPGVLIEAMSFGCACISFDCPYGPREIIENNVNGILVENQNIDDLSITLENLINNEEKQKYLSLNALKIKEKYEYNKIMSQWKNLIEEILAN
jgi:GalNAc-alpha-(1->4)-GalNAc-alpha-(1->3)-diNAcBac-PP-undecaprenol alpha-1,4-N-acetyl-D-galactosaminyltransferase